MFREPILQHLERSRLKKSSAQRTVLLPVLFVNPQSHTMLDEGQREQLVALLAAGILRRCAAQRDKEPDGDVFGHSSMELASYGDPSRPKSLILLRLGIMEKFNIFGHTQWRRARKNKCTAHGGKAAVAATLSGAGRRDAYPTNSRRSRLHRAIRVSRMNQN